MAATSGVSIPIKSWKVLGTTGAQAPMDAQLEATGQTFLTGTPVQVSAGFMQACPAITSVATAVIAGFSTQFGQNLATAGTGQTLTYGKVQNQPLAVLIPLGAPLSDGNNYFLRAMSTQVLMGLMGHSGTASLAVLAQTDVGAVYGLTKDSNGFWYIDKNITTTAGGACVQILQLIDPVGTLNGRVGFIVNPAAQQLVQ